MRRYLLVPASALLLAFVATNAFALRAVKPAGPHRYAQPEAMPEDAAHQPLSGLAAQAAREGVEVLLNSRLGNPRLVRGADLGSRRTFSGGKGLKVESGGRTASDATAVLDNLAGLFRIRDAAREFTIKAKESDPAGGRHWRALQLHNGLRVVGGELLVHFDKRGQAYEVAGFYIPDIDEESVPDIPADAAVEAARLELQREEKSGGALLDAPELVIFALNSDPVLAWEFVIRDTTGEEGLWRCWVDAAHGKVLLRIDELRRIGAPTANGSHTAISGSVLAGEGGISTGVSGWFENNGYYYLYNKTNRWFIYNAATSGYSDNNTYAFRNGASWGTSDRAEMSAARNYQALQSYYELVHGRSSFDNAGVYARANVHKGVSYVNAYWDPYQQQFFFGDGDGVAANHLGVLDICGHEFTHAVVEHTADLYYSEESGALNESFADIFGACIEFHTQPDGRGFYPDTQAGHADWLVGEDAWISSRALRDLRNPSNLETVGVGNQLPSRYKGTHWYYGLGDNGGVHYNLGVQNFFFYLLCEGGSGNNDGIGYTVDGIGITNAEKVAYRALTVYMGRYTDYAAARSAWISAAMDFDQDWADSVQSAWAACGIGVAVNTVAAPTFSPPGGVLETTTLVTVTCATPDATIRYTLDNSEPSETSPLYSTPIQISSDTTIKARAYKEGMTASPTAAAVYMFLGTRIYNFPMDSSPAWTVQGQWAFGSPAGGGGQYGSPDPVGGFTGPNVYGYNLSGDYPNSMANTMWLTTSVLDLRNVSNTKLAFRRWLGVERAVYDEARIEVSNNGTTWVSIWENDVEVVDTAWIHCVYDISSVADRQATVYVRWGMGPTDGGWRYCGWNLDDVEIWGDMTASTPPDAPDALQAAALATNNVRLNWHDRSDNEQGFAIERRTGAGSFDEIARTGANTTQYSDTNTSPSTAYAYRVRAYNASGYSAYTEEVSATTPQYSGDIWDPADDATTGASSLAAPTAATQSHGTHTLSPIDLADWFRIYLTNGTACSFDSIGGEGDLCLEVYADAAATTLLASDDDSGGNGQFSLDFQASSTRSYYLKVRTFNPGENASYSLNYRNLARAGTLGEAVNAPLFTWTTGGDAQWGPQTTVTRDGIAAAGSGAIDHNQWTYMETSVTGPGTFSFWWRVSCEKDYDFLALYVNDTLRARITGNTAWQKRACYLPGGSNTLTWAYIKDASISSGTDAAWMDMFSFEQNKRPCVIDLDSDRRADMSVFHPSSGNWHLLCSAGPAQTLQWGFAGCVPVAGDYNGDGEGDMAVFNALSGHWYIRPRSGEPIAWEVNWGWRGATPVSGDYDGDGISDLAVMDQANGRWFIYSARADVLAWDVNWGWAGARALSGDYDGDGISDLAVMDERNGRWFIYSLARNEAIAWDVNWGWAGAIPLSGDYDGDGHDDLAVFDGSAGNWFVYSIAKQTPLIWNQNWGYFGVRPVSGDFDGDRKTDLAVYDPRNSMWYVLLSAGGAIHSQWGYQGVIPLVP